MGQQAWRDKFSCNPLPADLRTATETVHLGRTRVSIEGILEAYKGTHITKVHLLWAFSHVVTRDSAGVRPGVPAAVQRPLLLPGVLYVAILPIKDLAVFWNTRHVADCAFMFMRGPVPGSLAT